MPKPCRSTVDASANELSGTIFSRYNLPSYLGRPMVGETISQYRIIEKLGEGGMGVVYKAEDSKLRRTVALKFLQTDAVEGEEHRVRFLREVQAAASLDHPNICTIHEVGEARGRVFFAMALIEGETLAQRIRNGPLTVDESLILAIQVAEGLEAAHEKQVVHRDIKPGNIIVTPKGRAIIVDFGLAQIGERSRLTHSGATLGTAAYMSPEQVQGSYVDGRSDIWSLGVVLYEMITGQLPFDADYHVALMYSVLNEEPKPATSLRPDAPPGINGVIRRALAKQPKERYQNARELIGELSVLRVDPHSKSLIAQHSVSPMRLIRRKWKSWLLPATIALASIGLTATVTLTLVDRNDTPATTDLTSTTPGARAFFEQANRYLERYEVTENLDNAIKLFQQATGADPNFATAHAGLAEAYRRYYERTRDPKWLTGARTAAENALLLDDKSAQVSATLGAVLNNLGQYAEAEKHLKNALAIDESSVDATRFLAGAYEGLGRIEEAETNYKRAIQLDPSDWTGYKTLGVFYANQRRYQDAEQQFKTLISLTPDNTIGHNNLGVTYQYMGRFREAAEAFKKSLAIRETGSAYSNLGVAYYFQNLYDAAAEAFSKAVELAPNNYLYWGNLADSYRRLLKSASPTKMADTYRRAIELLERELAVTPSDPAKRARLGYYLAASGKKEDAWAEVDQALKIAPEDSDILFHSALVYKLTGRPQDAEVSMQSALNNGYPAQLVKHHPDWLGLP
jgi:serine/threonine protein kinase/Flp pilus assembly protein TadD